MALFPIFRPTSTRRVLLFGVACLPFCFLIGCSGGSSTSASVAPQKRSVNLLLTDSLRDDYDQVWVGITRVELLTGEGVAEPIYDDLIGFQIDARKLRDAQGPRYSFLTRKSVSDKPFSSVRVTFRGAAQLLPKNQFQSRTFAYNETVERDERGSARVTFPLRTERAFAEGDNLIVDIDLANFRVVGETVIPALQEGTGEGVKDTERLDSRDYLGSITAVSGKSGSGVTFGYSADNTVFEVVTTADTVISAADGSANPEITAGVAADVRARLDTTTGKLVASAVRVYPRPTGGNSR